MIALHFSGGKDSLACLLLNKHRLHDIVVMWVDTGKNFPCVLETVARARAWCPNWETISTDQEAWIKKEGLPADVVPINATTTGRQFVKRNGIKVQSYLGCCAHNLWEPLWRRTKELEVTEVIRGQRADESHTAPVTSGQIVDGVTVTLPVEHWSRDEVLAYLKEELGELPEHLLLEHSSMDCWDCTAYWPALTDRREFVRARYPDQFAKIQQRMTALRQEIDTDMKDFPSWH